MTSADPDHESGEDRLIAKYFRPLAGHPGAFGLMDDAAAFTPPDGCDVVLKTDPIIGGVHFFIDDPAEIVARKALRVNLSDLAAKGAKPAGFLLALALPTDIGEDWLEGFARGLGADAEAFGCPLFGGDTDKTPGLLTISITAFGTLPRGTMVRRSGAKPGDLLFVSGTIGDAALGLMLRRDPNVAARHRLDPAVRDHLVGRYRLPQPRTALADGLRQHASAAMDISDGLAGDLAKLCRASGVSAKIEARRVPMSDAASAMLHADAALVQTVLTGGDDYEILAVIPTTNVEAFRTSAAAAAVPVAEIGRIVDGRAAPRLLDADGRPLRFARASYSHF